MLFKRFKKEEGFTLIELLVVIAVLGVLSGIIAPRITGVLDDARESALEANAANLRNTLEMHIARYGDMPGVDDPDNGDQNEDAWFTWTEDGVTMSQPDGVFVSTDTAWDDVEGEPVEGEPDDWSIDSYSVTIEDTHGNQFIVADDGITATP